MTIQYANKCIIQHLTTWVNKDQHKSYNEEKDAEYQHANKTGNERTVIYMLTTRHIDTHQHICMATK